MGFMLVEPVEQGSYLTVTLDIPLEDLIELSNEILHDPLNSTTIPLILKLLRHCLRRSGHTVI